MNKRLLKIMKALALVLILLSLVLLFSTCSLIFSSNEPEPETKKENKTETETELTANEQVYEKFKEWYLWYNELPEIDPESYETIHDVVNALRTKIDRWSFAGSYSEIMDLYQRGDFKGFGAGFILDSDNKIKITHVYKHSPMGKLGVERGWIVESVNGISVPEIDKINSALASTDTVQFLMIDLEGNDHHFQMKKEQFSLNTVLHYSVHKIETYRIGYIVFNSFVSTSIKELETAFNHFVSKGINQLIVDLRYNGGGMVNVANTLCGMIGGEKINGQNIAYTTHNDKKTNLDKSTVLKYEGVSLNIDEVTFIVSGGTASASELVINNLTPFMNVNLIGNTSYGKPVGMYILSVPEIDLAVVPVSFKNVNSLGYGDYYSGFEPHVQAPDDLSKNWGNTEELMLKKAINYIRDPASLAAHSAEKSQSTTQKLFEYQNLNQIINAY